MVTQLVAQVAWSRSPHSKSCVFTGGGFGWKCYTPPPLPPPSPVGLKWGDCLSWTEPSCFIPVLQVWGWAPTPRKGRWETLFFSLELKHKLQHYKVPRLRPQSGWWMEGGNPVFRRSHTASVHIAPCLTSPALILH